MKKLVCILFAVSIVVVPANAAELLAYYPLDGNYDDYADGLYPLVPFGTPTFVGGKFGQAVLFDGPVPANASEYLRNNTGLNAVLANDSDFTVLFWVKTTQTGYSGFPEFQQPGMVSAEKGGPEDWSTYIDANGHVGFYVQAVGFPPWPTSTIPINNGEWRHIAVTRNNTTGNLQIYIDGVLLLFEKLNVTKPNVR